ncbi:MAG: DNA-3-methyladenine glycosylase I [Rhodospirillaceae bacterium]
MPHYCDTAPQHEVHAVYHEQEYGFPVAHDHILFERLALEINQAGLSWEIVLRKRAAIWESFRGFNPKIVAEFGTKELDSLLANPGIIRNRLKIESIIHNAGVISNLAQAFGSFSGWLSAQHPLPVEEWTILFKKTFKFTGKEITREFLMSTGYLQGAHREDCPVFRRIVALKPPWLEA